MAGEIRQAPAAGRPHAGLGTDKTGDGRQRRKETGESRRRHLPQNCAFAGSRTQEIGQFFDKTLARNASRAQQQQARTARGGEGGGQDSSRIQCLDDAATGMIGDLVHRRVADGYSQARVVQHPGDDGGNECGKAGNDRLGPSGTRPGGVADENDRG